MTYLESLRGRLVKEAAGGGFGAFNEFLKAHPMLNFAGSSMLVPRISQQVNQTLQGLGVGEQPQAPQPQSMGRWMGKYPQGRR